MDTVYPPTLSYVDSVSDVKTNNYVIVNGGGYDSYLKAIDNSVLDCNSLDYLTS